MMEVKKISDQLLMSAKKKKNAQSRTAGFCSQNVRSESNDDTQILLGADITFKAGELSSCKM